MKCLAHLTNTIFIVWFVPKAILAISESDLGDLGTIVCFDNESPLIPKPLDVKDLDTKFLVCTSFKDRTVIEMTDSSLSASPYDKTVGAIFLVHGYNNDVNNYTQYNIQYLIDGLRKVDTRNVVLVDWTKGAKPGYLQAVANGKVVAVQIAHMVKFLQKATGVSSKDFYIIGHSLGAEVSGLAAKNISGLSRITGLDPAGPCFYKSDKTKRLDKSDADYVDIIHTNGANTPFDGLGLLKAIGDIDFYVNGGKSQPGCNQSPILPTLITRAAVSCSHMRAVVLFQESMNNSQCQFIGTQCENYEKLQRGQCDANENAVMGYYANKKAPGMKFYLNTAGEYPYCIQN